MNGSLVVLHEKMATSNQGAAKWRLMKTIVQSVHEVNGTVFGGYVRDSIIHDHYASEFYSKAEELHRYSDVTYMPELALRTHMPKDIDCFILSSNLSAFKNSLKKKKLDIYPVNENTTNIYFLNIPIQVKHINFKIAFAMNSILKSTIDTKPFEILIDVLHSDVQMEPPFKVLDFECNSLVLTPTNDYKLCNLIPTISPLDKITRMNEIINNIVQKETYVFGKDVCYKRINRMLDKRWKISGPKSVLYRIDTETDEVCSICLDQYKIYDAIVSIRCCKGSKMHRKCAHKMINENFTKCTICREEIDFTPADKKIMGCQTYNIE